MFRFFCSAVVWGSRGASWFSAGAGWAEICGLSNSHSHSQVEMLFLLQAFGNSSVLCPCWYLVFSMVSLALMAELSNAGVVTHLGHPVTISSC